MRDLEFTKDILDIRNTTYHLRKKTKKCRTWKDLALMLFDEFLTDKTEK